MEQENRLEQNRYSKPFVGLSTAQEADSVIAGNDKEKPNTCVAANKVDDLMEILMRRESFRNLSQNKKQVSERAECQVIYLMKTNWTIVFHFGSNVFIQ